MANKYFEVEKKTVSDVYIEPKVLYKIPRFQRQYSWEEKNIDEFWESLFSKDTVFLGTIILNTKDKHKNKIVEIIDGQQRYLTIQILGSVIKNTYLEISEKEKDEKCKSLAKGIHKRILGRQDIDDEDKFQDYLIPGDSIKAFFKEHIQNNPGTLIVRETKVKRNTEEDRVKKAYLRFNQLISQAIAKKTLSQKKEFLKSIIDNNLGKHFFAVIEIDDDDLAYEIFETVNAKGVDLSVADLIKNQIFKNIIGEDSRYIDSAKERWNDLTEKLEEANINMKDFLSYYWTSKYGYVSDKKLYAVIRNKFKEVSKKWDEFLDDLILNADYFNSIINGNLNDIIAHFNDRQEGTKAYNSLRVLRNTKAKTWSILYLCLFRNMYSQKNIKPKSSLQLNNRWEILEKFTFLYFQILNAPGNWYFKLIWNFCKKIEDATKNNKNKNFYINLFSNDLFKEFRTRKPSYELFDEGIRNIEYKDDQKTRVIIRYILNEIEKKIGGKDDEGYDENKISIEHILPQNPKEWRLNKKEIKKYVNKLGNLTLIGRNINGNLGNKALSQKVKMARKSKINLVKDLLKKIKNKEWDFDSISKSKDFTAIELRQTYLTQKAHEIWVDDLLRKMGV